MAVPASVEEFIDLVRKSGVADEKNLDNVLASVRTNPPADPAAVADLLVQRGVLTHFQAKNILAGKWRRFTIGKYKVLEQLGSGGFAQVYLCEHKMMQRRVAVKVLPVAKTKGSSALERFYREARAAATLDHPNIVHAFDIDQDGELHYLVMEYVDGPNLQEIVKRTGPMSVLRACHYIAQAAHALQHAHEQGMVHRDIKPGNFLVDRTGVVKLLDLGLALVFDEKDNQLTKIHDDGALGTADYLSPEQAIDSHEVDIRADIYSLGVTFYFLLAGRAPYEGLPIADKLLAHQMKQPPPMSDFRKDVPAEILAIMNKMMAKNASQRYATPGEVAEALEPYIQTPIAPPSEAEMPVLSPLAASPSPGGSSPGTPAVRVPAPAAPVAMATASPVVADEANEPAPWDRFATDTDSAAAQEGTATSEAPARSKRVQAASSRSTLIMVVLILGFIVLPIFVAAGIGVVIYVFAPSPAKVEDAGPPKLEVSRDGTRKNAYRSIQAALRNASQGSVVELWDESYQENVVFEGGKGGRTAITLQAAPGKEVVWRAAGNDPETPILRLIKTREFTFKGSGITFDGALPKDRAVNDLISITSSCSGMVIEDLQLRHFARTAVLIMNAAGSKESPILLNRLWTFTQPGVKPRAAIFFDANPTVTPALNDHIEIRACKFHGLEPAESIQFNNERKILGDDVHWPGK